MISARIRIDFGPGSAVGPGKIALLEAIAATGSLSAAARDLGMSYRRAWLLLASLNTSLQEPVTAAKVGGRGGGGVRLTPFGQLLVARYRSFEAAAGKLAARSFRDLAPGDPLRPRRGAGPKPTSRGGRPAAREPAPGPGPRRR